MPTSKNNRKGKKRKRKTRLKGKATPVSKGWDGRGGYSKTGGDGFIYLYSKYHKVMKIIRPDTWLFTCPIDPDVVVAVEGLDMDTPRHCEQGLPLSTCAFIAAGCTGCSEVAAVALQHKIEDMIINGENFAQSKEDEMLRFRLSGDD